SSTSILPLSLHDALPIFILGFSDPLSMVRSVKTHFPIDYIFFRPTSVIFPYPMRNLRLPYHLDHSLVFPDLPVPDEKIGGFPVGIEYITVKRLLTNKLREYLLFIQRLVRRSFDLFAGICLISLSAPHEDRKSVV